MRAGIQFRDRRGTREVLGRIAQSSGNTWERHECLLFIGRRRGALVVAARDEMPEVPELFSHHLKETPAVALVGFQVVPFGPFVPRFHKDQAAAERMLKNTPKDLPEVKTEIFGR